MIWSEKEMRAHLQVGEKVCPILSLRHETFFASLTEGHPAFVRCLRDHCAWFNGVVCGIAAITSLRD